MGGQFGTPFSIELGFHAPMPCLLGEEASLALKLLLVKGFGILFRRNKSAGHKLVSVW